MDSFYDHLLILDEISTGLIQHAAEKASRVASDARKDAKQFNKASDAAFATSNMNTYKRYKIQRARAENYANAKDDQAERFNKAVNYRNYIKDENISVPTRRY